MCCSAHAVRKIGAHMLSIVIATTAGIFCLMPRNAPVRSARGTRTTAPRTVLPKTSAAGEMSCTATRMKRKELPEITEALMKRTSALRLISSSQGFLGVHDRLLASPVAVALAHLLRSRFVNVIGCRPMAGSPGRHLSCLKGVSRADV